MNLLGPSLIPIVHIRPHIVIGLPDQLVNNLFALLPFQVSGSEPLLQPVNGLLSALFKAGEVPLGVGDHLHEEDQFGGLLVQLHEPVHHVLPEPFEAQALNSPQDRHVVCFQFELDRFKLNSLPRSIGQEKAEINVDQVAVLVQDQICVVAVLDLKNVAD